MWSTRNANPLQRDLTQAQDLIQQAHWVIATWAWAGKANILVQPLGCETLKREMVKKRQTFFGVALNSGMRNPIGTRIRIWTYTLKYR